MPATTIGVSRFALALALALSAIVGACAHGAAGEHTAREAPAPHLRGVADARAEPGPAAHAEALADPASARDVTLAGLLAYADRHSPVLVVARSTRSRAEAAHAGASQLLPSNPEVSLAAGPRFGQGGTAVDFTVGLTQELEIAGERGVRLDAADRLRDLTNAEIEEIRWAVHCDVHATFHRALVERERVLLVERVVAFQEEVLRVVERQTAAGETAALSLRLAQAEVAQARQVLVGAQQALLASRIRLAQLAGWPAARPPSPAGAIDAPRDPPPEDRLLALARRRLPSLRAGTARIREAQARAAVADREVWPRPSVGVEYVHEGSPSNDGSEIVMGVLSIPIPTFQTNQGPRASARADALVAAAELGAMRTLLAGQIVEARAAVVGAAGRTRAYGTEILPRFEENLTLLRRSFELGEIDILDLSTGRERFLRIQSDALDAQRDYFDALTGLERIVGVDLWRDDHHEESTP